jgi:hypothetical protein
MFFWSLYMLKDVDFASATCGVVTHHLTCSPPAMDAIAGGYDAWRIADAQRVFNWAEASFPALFAPGTGQAGNLGGYTYRYYPQDTTFLATRAGDIYLHNGRNWNIQNVGRVSAFIDTAAAAGF